MSFSVIIYNLSTKELNQSLRKQPAIFFQDERGNESSYEQFRQARIDEVADHLRQNFIIFNLFVFFLGGVVSYVLARRTLDPIEEAIEAQGRFTADASHELRTPLTAMKTEIEVALRDPSLTKADARELLESNLEEVSKLTTLSNALLKLARLDAKPIELSSRSAKKIIQLAQKNSSKTLKLHKAKLKVEAEDFKFDADCDAMVEVLSILIDNAMKYGDNTKSIVLSSKSQDGQAIFEVSNLGAGINPSDLPRIFDRFYRADNSRTKTYTEGYGLGLSLAKQIVEMHHGKISVVSVMNGLTVFTIKIPIHKLSN